MNEPFDHRGECVNRRDHEAEVAGLQDLLRAEALYCDAMKRLGELADRVDESASVTVCPTCQGSGADPEDPGDWVPEVGMYHPRSGGPCPDCNGTGCACGEPGAPGIVHRPAEPCYVAERTPCDFPPCENGGEPCNRHERKESHELCEDECTRRTTKYVTGTFKLTFHGDYIDAEDAEQYAHDWLDAGLSDRDDLKGWTFEIHGVQEVNDDPEGYDR